MEYIYDVWLSNLNVVINNGRFAKFSPDANWGIDSNRFKQSKFYFVTKGGFEITIEGKEYTAQAGDWFFVPANALHSCKNNTVTGFEKYWIHFDLYPTDTDIFNLFGLPYVIHTKNDRKTLALFKRFTNADTNKVTDILEAKACTLQLLSRYILLAQTQSVEIKSTNEERIDNILNYINDNLDKDLSNDKLAKICYLHPNHFIRFFKAKTNQTPASYIRQRRMEKARRLLEKSDLSVSEIAHKVGIEDEGYFSKQFKQFYSMSPRDWKKYYKWYARR